MGAKRFSSTRLKFLRSSYYNVHIVFKFQFVIISFSVEVFVCFDKKKVGERRERKKREKEEMETNEMPKSQIPQNGNDR